MSRYSKSFVAGALLLAITGNVQLAKADGGATTAEVVKVVEEVVKYGPKVYDAIVDLQGHHQVYPWKQDESGKLFTVLPLVDHDGSRMTDNVDKAPFLIAQRRATFRLVNVRAEDAKRVYWEVKSDVPGRGDGHRQFDDAHKTRDGESIWLDKAAGKDFAYYLAGRWDEGLSEAEFWARNPNASVVIVLE